jgi:hypothetical protein
MLSADRNGLDTLSSPSLRAADRAKTKQQLSTMSSSDFTTGSLGKKSSDPFMFDQEPTTSSLNLHILPRSRGGVEVWGFHIATRSLATKVRQVPIWVPIKVLSD